MPLRDRAAICSSAAIRLTCELEGEAKANVVVTVRWRVIVAIGGAAVLRVVVLPTMVGTALPLPAGYGRQARFTRFEALR